jgi:LysM repeat protein
MSAKRAIVSVSTVSMVLLLSACSSFQVEPEQDNSTQLPEADVIPIVVNVPPVNIEPAPNMQTPPVHVVQRGEALYGIGQRYNLNYKDIAAWNNILPPYTLQPGQTLQLILSQPTVIEFDLATGVMTTVPAANTSKLSQSPVHQGMGRYHTVIAGDTLYSLSRRYGVNFKQIAANNGIVAPYQLRVGQSLHISNNATLSRASVITPISIAAPQVIPAQDNNAIYHIVQKGDSLSSIASRYGHSHLDVAAWNRLSAPYGLTLGNNLRVSAPQGGLSAAAAPTLHANTLPVPHTQNNTQLHTVARGETLYSISRLYQQDVDTIAHLNHLTVPYTLSVGQQLRLTGTEISANNTAVLHVKQSAPRQFNGEVVYHEVKEGESLASIAGHYGQNTHELALWNGIAAPYPVYPGQTVIIYR